MTALLGFATAALGYIFSLLFEFFPGLASWHDGLTPKKKALLHATLSAALGLAALYLSCVDAFSHVFGLTCTPFTAENALTLILLAYSGNQASYNTAVKWRAKGDGSKG
jgi:hypothetical protein